jgi:CubicO group peptidase (beta-lactamase class C family)
VKVLPGNVQALLGASALMLFSAVAHANSAIAPQVHHELERVDLEAWLDGFLPRAMVTGDIAGGVVVIVKDGNVLLQKGYGYADIERGVRVDPDRTMFRPGSVSKLFTWTAVMQLVEAGKLDLDQDINTYLDFTIPRAFGSPITLRNLMTHTAGFEEALWGTMFSDTQSLPSLELYVKKALPRRIYPPGQVAAYSNYGASLAGYIVQRVSRESFDDYMHRHIFGPLGMQHSTFRQAMPGPEAELSKGYASASSPSRPFERVGPTPAGALSATGADMARFMIAHLQAEGGGSPGFLRPDTARLMHRSVSKSIAPLKGMSLGFYEANRNGRRIIGHGGDTAVFHSDMNLLIDDGVGLFVSFNSTGSDGAAYDVLTAIYEEFVDRYFPGPMPDEPTAPTSLAHANLIAEWAPYQSARRVESSFARLLSLFDQKDVLVNPDGTLVLPDVKGINGQSKVWRETGDYVWREVGGTDQLAARVVNGKVQSLGFDPFAGAEIMQPVPRYRSSAWNLPARRYATVALVLTLILWPVCAIVRRRYGVVATGSRHEKTAHTLARFAALISVLFLCGWVAILQNALSDLTLFNGDLDPWVRLMQVIGLVGIAGTAVAFWNAWLTWQSHRRWFSKVWSVVIAVSCLEVAWFALAFCIL